MQKDLNKITFPYRMAGKVVRGKGLGKTVGMPTANLQTCDAESLPAGVYATRIWIDGQDYISVTNIGTRPTVDQDACITVESHIADFDGDIYGKEVQLDVLGYLRDIKKFDTLEDVWEQVQKDISDTKRYFA